MKMKTHLPNVWVLTFDPIPGVRETAMVFDNYLLAEQAQEALPEGSVSMLQGAPMNPVVETI